MNKLLIYTVLGCFLMGMPAYAKPLQPPPEGFSQDKLAIRTTHGKLHFTVELAKTPLQMQYGLMNREALADNYGMLFLQTADHPMSMWMKDTEIALDMLFIDSHGRIVYIAQRTTPNSTDLISAGKPVRAVLELAGGLADKKNIRVGDRVVYRDFKP